MGIFDRQNAAPMRRKVEPTLNNTAVISSSDSSGRLAEIFGVTTASGAVVNESTSMRVSAVYACIRLIAGAVAGLPIPIYERVDDETRRVDHDYWWLLNERPCAAWSSSAYWEYNLTQMLLRGSGINYLARNRAGRVTDILPWPRSGVRVEREKQTDPRMPRRLRYFFQAEEGYFGADQDDVLHFPGFGFDGCDGMSVIQWGARTGIGIAIRADEYAGKFFSQGGQPQIAVKTTGKMNATQQDAFREAWVAKYAQVGGPNGMPLILTEGLSVEQLSLSAADAQLLESRQWQVVDVARAFGVPPFMIAEMGKATYNNTENLGADFVKYTLGPHLNRIKAELNAKLFPRSARFFAEHNVDGLLRGDAKTRSEYYKASLGGTQNPAWLTPNEVRRLENKGRIDGGDKLYTPKDNPAPPPAPKEDKTDETSE